MGSKIRIESGMRNFSQIYSRIKKQLSNLTFSYFLGGALVKVVGEHGVEIRAACSKNQPMS